MSKEKIIILVLVIAALCGWTIALRRTEPKVCHIVEPPPVSTSVVPPDYYDGECPKPEDMEMEEWLDGLEWNEPYERNLFDCSRMAAMMEWAFETCGWSAFITVIPNHALLLVYDESGEHRFFEATDLRFLKEEEVMRLRRFCPFFLFSDLHAVEEWYRKTSHADDFPREMVWWDESGPRETFNKLISFEDEE